MDINDQKNVAKEVFSLLRKINPKVTLAGGAPRDWYLNKTARDLDFYIYLPLFYRNNIKRELSLLFNIPKEDIIELGTTRDDSYRGNPVIEQVYEFSYKNMDIQIISLISDYNSDTIVKTFDYSICQIYTLNCDDLFPHENFLLSIEAGFIFGTNLSQDSNLKYKRLLKLMQKFPDHKFFTEKPYGYITEEKVLARMNLTEIEESNLDVPWG